MAKIKKPKIVKIDGGIIPEEVDRLRKAIRQVWQWTSVARKNCIKRATNAEGFGVCENPECRKIVPKVTVDHNEVMGDPREPGYIVRMYCGSEKLTALCLSCHAKKSRLEKKEAMKARQDREASEVSPHPI